MKNRSIILSGAFFLFLSMVFCSCGREHADKKEVIVELGEGGEGKILYGKIFNNEQWVGIEESMSTSSIFVSMKYYFSGDSLVSCVINKVERQWDQNRNDWARHEDGSELWVTSFVEVLSHQSEGDLSILNARFMIISSELGFSHPRTLERAFQEARAQVHSLEKSV